MKFTSQHLAIAVGLCLYFSLTLVIGWLSRKAGKSSRTFLNPSYSLPLPIIVAAILATNCGGSEIIGMSAMAAQYGVQTLHFYWIGGIPAIIFLALWLMPVYRRSRISSVPEYLDKRFNPSVRLLNACVVAIVQLLLGGVSLYAMAQVLSVIAGMSFLVSILLSACVVLAYILVGGIRATIYNQVFQLLLLIAGLSPLAFRSRHFLPAATQHVWTPLPFASMKAPLDQLGILFGLGFVLSFGYWCTDFVLMQRAFAAKTEEQAREVPLWSGFVKLLFPLLIVVPGLAAGSLFPELTNSGHFDRALPLLMARLYGSGMMGLGVAAVVASLTSALAANVAGFSAVTTNDIYRAYIARGKSDSHYLAIGRWMMVAAIATSLVASYLNFSFHNLMEHVQLIVSVFGAPFWAVFLLGMGSTRTDSRGAIAGFVSGSCVALLHVIATTRGWLHYGSNLNADFHVAMYAFSVALAVGWLGSGRRTETSRQRLLRFRWREDIMGKPHVRLLLLSALLAVCFFAVNIYSR